MNAKPALSELDLTRQALELAKENNAFYRELLIQQNFLKSSCLHFIVAKGMYEEYAKWQQKKTTRDLLKNIDASLK